MTKADAMQNVVNALSGYRVLHGEPSEIEVVCAYDVRATIRSGWSKSAVQKTRFERQTVFLAIDSGNQWPQLAMAKCVIYGAEWFEIDTAAIKGPEESGYWLLPVKVGR